jgi:hypothetical protein
MLRGADLAMPVACRLGAGGEACGYRWPERAVFKHPYKLLQHEKRRTTNGRAFEGDTKAAVV